MNAISPDAARLRAVRTALADIAPGHWQRVQSVEGAFVEARGEMPGEVFVLARFGAAATVDEINFVCDGPDTIHFLLGLLDKAFREIRSLRGLPEHRQHDQQRGEPAARNPKNFAAECAMRCQDAAFKVFLEERHGLERPLTDERVAQKVRSLLGVQSRKELNNGGRAGEAWIALRGAFATWLKAGQ
ncbi:MAG: hypothetical protein EOS70_23340 [Mesorhizobium sp.]|uniref:hypothetical protein n=1 Tax=Mesorhizobium sp. TaxID=1871066 RepID=UPI000FE831CC|nr:hypothetical protein [Mesorhizobium sp.]RWC29826.1 MAG: hypothetical protein EOS70_23340 [Mesorhizobium sp.]